MLTPLVEAAAALLGAAEGNTLGTVALNKALFYLDLAALRDHGAVITGQPYVALPKGPVIAKYERRLIGALADAGIAEQLEGEAYGKPVTLRRALHTFEHLTATQLEPVESIAKWIAAKSAKWLSDHSHKNPGWIIAWKEGLGRGPGHEGKLINMRIAMQQVLDDDPWLVKKPTSAEMAAFGDAKNTVADF